MATKEYHKEKTKQYRAARRQYVAAYKMEIGCELCGYAAHSAALHLDHINPEEKLVTVSRMISEGHSFDAIDAELSKCRVLCANCHSIHTYESEHFRIPRMGDPRT